MAPGRGGRAHGRTCPWVYGIDQDALALMIENHRTGLVRDRLQRSPQLQAGLCGAPASTASVEREADSLQRLQSGRTGITLIHLTIPSIHIAMTDPRIIRVAVNGYGVIGKRGADAVAAQNDMTLAGVADVATDWRVTVALDRDYPLYGATPEHTWAMTEANLDPAGVLAQTVDPDLDVVTMAVKVPETIAHLHYWAVQLTRKSSKDEVLDAFCTSTRIALIHMTDDLVALNSVKELMSDFGRPTPTSTKSRSGPTAARLIDAVRRETGHACIARNGLATRERLTSPRANSARRSPALPAPA